MKTELAQMKQLLGVTQKKTLWWDQIAGSFENDPNFDEAVRFGQEWRKSAGKFDCSLFQNLGKIVKISQTLLDLLQTALAVLKQQQEFRRATKLRL